MHEFLPYLKNIEIHNSIWDFIKEMNLFLSQIKFDLDEEIECKILGRWSSDLVFNFLKAFPNDLIIDIQSLEKFVNNIKSCLISDNTYLKEILKNQNNKNRDKYFRLIEEVRIVDKIDLFNFTIVKYGNIICILLFEGEKLNFNNYLIIKNDLNMFEFFDKLFEY